MMTTEELDVTEKSVIGGLLRWNEKIDDVVGFLRAEDFRTVHHRLIYASIVRTWNAGKPVDAVALANDLNDCGHIKEIGGYGYISELLEKEPTGANTVHHARLVRNRSIIRQLNFAAKEIVCNTELGAGDAEHLVEEAERKIFAIGEIGCTQSATRIDAAVNAYFDLIDERARREDGLGGLATGLLDIDQLTGGLNDGEVTILAARTSVGKTSLALQIARNAAVASNFPTLFVSLEMSESELVQRVLCGVAKVDGRKLRIGKPSKDDGEQLLKARRLVSQAPLYIDDRPQQRMMRIAATARRLKRQDGLRLLVVDYLQLVEPEDRRAPRNEQVSQVSRRLKSLAKDLNIPVLALAQLSRAAEEKDKPKLYHLRESGSLEQDADVVLLMHRNEENQEVIEVDVAKNRNGPTGLVKLAFDRRFTSFQNYIEGPPIGG